MSDKSHLLEPRYNQQILIAEKHLQTKAKGKGTKINKERIGYLVEIGAQCPICGIRFEGGNHNTEHIFPSGLGGENKNHNKIQMCVACNSARNQILQLLGHPPWYDRYPENFEHVKKVLIWCLITVEDGIHSGKQVPEIHDKFMQYRTGGQEFPNKPTKSFGPASTWVVGDNPNYLHNHSPNNRTQSGKAPTTSLTLSVFDWIFGYKSKAKTPPSKNLRKTTDERAKAESEPKVERKLFTNLIRDLIGEDSIYLQELGKRIAVHQKENGMGDTTTKTFLKSYGFGSKTGLLKAIQMTLAGEVVYNRESQSPKIGLSTHPITKFVNTHSGLRLPREPQAFSDILVWLSTSMQDFENHIECREAIREANLLAKSPVPLLLGLYKVFNEDQEYLEASKIIVTIKPHQVCEKYLEYYSNNKISGMDPAPATSEIKEGLTKYMNAAISHLSAADEVA